MEDGNCVWMCWGLLLEIREDRGAHCRSLHYAPVGMTKGRVVFSGKAGEWLKELRYASVWMTILYRGKEFKGHLHLQVALESWQAASCSRWLSRSSCIGNSYRCVP